MKVSDHISYKEVIYSQTAIRHGLNNEPSPEQLSIIKGMLEAIFEPLRAWVGGAIRANSIFRGILLNKRIGGSTTSQHCVDVDPEERGHGAAIDTDDTYGRKTNREMFHYIKDNLPFDQLIWEFGNSQNPDWVHASWRPDGKNRGQVLIAYRSGGKTRYVPLKGNEHRIT